LDEGMAGMAVDEPAPDPEPAVDADGWEVVKPKRK
jgi:hypothetical protein